MRATRSWAPAVGLAALLALSIPVDAADLAVLVQVSAGASEIGRALTAMNVHVTFLDGDGDSVADADEPVYLDLDDNSVVTVGDLRLTSFGGYPAGTSVTVTNQDAGRALARSPGWFGSSGGHWYADLDGGKTVSDADVLLDGTPVRVAQGSPARGQALDYPSVALLAGSLGVDDLDHDGRHDAGEAAYLDLDTATRSGPPIVGTGDYRFVSQGPGLDDTVTRAEFEQALAKAGVQQQNGSYERTVVEHETGSSWGTPETVLLLLGLVNLVGLVFVYTRLRDSGAPRNPFK
jgi:hypothetical protein